MDILTILGLSEQYQNSANIQPYLDLITSEHRDKPNFMALVSAVLGLVDDTAALADNFNSYFNIDQAYGAQLDILGEILGVSRTLTFQPADGSSPVLDDPTYQLVLKSRIAKNMWDGTVSGIYSLFASLFSGSVSLIFTDNQDMSASILVIGLGSILDQNLISHDYIIPRPEGVQYNCFYPQGKVFSYGMDNTYFGGYGDSNWVQPA